MHITDFVPPVFIKIVKMIGNANSSGANIFNSYGEAASACVGLGYEQDELINVVFLKTRAYRDWLSQTGNVMLTETMTQSLAGLSLALYARADDEISVLDFGRSEEHTSELQSLTNLVCRLLLEKKKNHKSPLHAYASILIYSKDPIT